MHININQP
jgi:hypothetical protein